MLHMEDCLHIPELAPELGWQQNEALAAKGEYEERERVRRDLCERDSAHLGHPSMVYPIGIIRNSNEKKMVKKLCWTLRVFIICSYIFIPVIIYNLLFILCIMCTSITIISTKGYSGPSTLQAVF
jgi:hypothetical protein